MGLAYRGERLSAVGIVEWNPWSSKRPDTAKADDGIAVTLGANYCFDFGKLYLAGQYFDNQWRLPTPSEIVPLAFNDGKLNDRMVKGYGLRERTFLRSAVKRSSRSVIVMQNLLIIPILAQRASPERSVTSIH